MKHQFGAKFFVTYLSIYWVKRVELVQVLQLLPTGNHTGVVCGIHLACQWFGQPLIDDLIHESISL